MFEYSKYDYEVVANNSKFIYKEVSNGVYLIVKDYKDRHLEGTFASVNTVLYSLNNINSETLIISDRKLLTNYKVEGVVLK